MNALMALISDADSLKWRSPFLLWEALAHALSAHTAQRSDCWLSFFGFQINVGIRRGLRCLEMAPPQPFKVPLISLRTLFDRVNQFCHTHTNRCKLN